MISGFQQPFMAWNIPLDISMLICILMLLGAVVQDMLLRGANVHELPIWLVIPAGLGDLMLMMFPWNLIICMSLWEATAAFGAPTSTVAMSVILTIFCWFLAMYAGFVRPISRNSQSRF